MRGGCRFVRVLHLRDRAAGGTKPQADRAAGFWKKAGLIIANPWHGRGSGIRAHFALCKPRFF
jgi:hypothetical protein